MDFYNNLGLRLKLALPIALIAAIMLVIAIMGINIIGGITASSNVIANQHLPRVEYLLQADRDLYQALVAERGMLFVDNKEGKFQDMQASHEENIQQAYDRVMKFSRLIDTDEAGDLIADFQRKFAQWKQRTNYLVGDLLQADQQSRQKAIELSYGEVDELFGQTRDIIDQLTELTLEDTAKTTAHIDEVSSSSRLTLFIATLVGLLFSAFIVMIFPNSILAPVRKLIDVAQSISEGDLSKKIESKTADELGNLMEVFSKMNVNLVEIVSSVTEGSSEVNRAAREIEQGSRELSDRTISQAASLEETAASLEEISVTISQNADHTRHANKLAQDAKQQAEKVRGVVGNAVTAMDGISKSSRRISDIITVMDEIAFQTNLLSLNAAVEAARAGEQGRSFAVVASEVGKLAQRSADSAKEIKELINHSVAEITEGTALVKTSGDHLEDILTSVKQVSDLVADIDAATQEQSAGINQVNEAVESLDKITQKNGALSSETAMACSDLNQQSENLQEQVRFFRI